MELRRKKSGAQITLSRGLSSGGLCAPVKWSPDMLVIGHPFEAEDESQSWPDLQAAIREARKTYQATATMPDWEKLAASLRSVAVGPT